jgi:hypothetical protein
MSERELSEREGPQRRSVPAHWPAAVRPPDTPDWEASAVGWLFDLVPGEYRAYPVLRRHPMLLSRFAAGHVEACLQAARAGWRSLRRDLGRDLPPEVVEAAMSAYEREGIRLRDLTRSVALVDAALRGTRWSPRL